MGGSGSGRGSGVEFLGEVLRFGPGEVPWAKSQCLAGGRGGSGVWRSAGGRGPEGGVGHDGVCRLASATTARGAPLAVEGGWPARDAPLAAASPPARRPRARRHPRPSTKVSATYRVSDNAVEVQQLEYV